MAEPVRLWGSWIQLARGEDDWMPCPENQHQQVKLDQRPLGAAATLLRLQVAVKLHASLARQFFALPEAVVACDPGSMRDPSQIFEMHFLEDFPPRKGEAAVQLTVDPETIWYQVLAANLQAAEWLEPHRGKWLVRRDFPDAACSSQVVTSEQSIYLDSAQVASPHPSDESQMLLTFLRLVPVAPLQFRLKHLCRASLSRCLQPWFAWLFSDRQALARAWSEAFYVTLSIENCNGPPLLPAVSEPRPFSLEDWTLTEDETFAAYLQHFLSAAGFGDLEVLGSLDGKQLAVHQAAIRRELWSSIAPRFGPIFAKSSLAYRRMAFFKLSLTESNPEWLEDSCQVAAKLNAMAM